MTHVARRREKAEMPTLEGVRTSDRCDLSLSLPRRRTRDRASDRVVVVLRGDVEKSICERGGIFIRVFVSHFLSH